VIREAILQDVDQIVSLGVKFIKDSPMFRDHPINIKRMQQYAIRTIREENRCYFVDDRDGKIVAFLSGYISPMIYSDDLVANEQLMFIDPDYKSSTRVGIRLMRKFEEWSRSKGVKIMWFSPTSHGVDDRWNSFCKTLGYVPQGGIFQKRL